MVYIPDSSEIERDRDPPGTQQLFRHIARTGMFRRPRSQRLRFRPRLVILAGQAQPRELAIKARRQVMRNPLKLQPTFPF